MDRTIVGYYYQRLRKASLDGSIVRGGPQVAFDEKTHTYTVGGRRMRSASELVAMIKPKFDKAEAALSGWRVGAKPGWRKRTLAKWDAEKEAACAKGKSVHAEAERVALDPAKAESDAGLPGWIKRHSDKLFCEATEWRLAWPELHFAGTVDAVCYSRVTRMRHVFDWKTNKRFRDRNKFGEKLKAPFDDLDDCELHCYSVQVGLYRLLVKHACPPWRTGPSYVVHVAPDGAVTPYKALDLRDRLVEWLKGLPAPV